MKMLSFVRKATAIQKLSFLYLFMTFLNTILLSFTGLGACLPIYGLLFFAGACLGANVVFLVISIVMLFASIAFLILAYVKLFSRKQSNFFLSIVILDLVASVFLGVFLSDFALWKTCLAIGYCLILGRFRQKENAASLL